MQLIDSASTESVGFIFLSFFDMCIDTDIHVHTIIPIIIYTRFENESKNKKMSSLDAYVSLQIF